VDLKLTRLFTGPDCSEGSIWLPDHVLYTLELPWIAEEGFPGGWPDRSCVPAGKYDLVLHDTAKHPRTFALSNPDLGVIHEPDSDHPNYRTACLIHVANTVQDLEGCIGVGMTHAPGFIGSSGIAFAYFRQALPWVAGHSLTIINPGVST
jgi:hypothetical protein